MPRAPRFRHRRFALAALSALLAAPPAAPLTPRPSPLTPRLDRLLAAPAFQNGLWGVYVYSLDRHRVLFDRNGGHWFTPASNAKLFTLAAALHLLGGDFRLHTALTSTAAPNPGGVIAGDVVLRGAGDPSLSGRSYPYRDHPSDANAPLLPPYDTGAAARALARQLAARGVTRIQGDIVGDDSAFDSEPYPPGWAQDDLAWGYGAPVSALTMNDNARFLELLPGEAAGAPARLTLDPALDPPVIVNQVLTTPSGTPNHINVETDSTTGAVRVSGRIAADSRGDEETIAVPDPALFAAAMLRQALMQAGIQVDGIPRARHRPPGAAAAPAAAGFDLGGWDSPPLAQLLQTAAKESQNLHAELMLRLLGALRGAPADQASTRAAGEAVVRAFLLSAGLGPDDTALVDGSGLSRLDLVTPAGMVRLLEFMARQPEAAVWRALLPIAGVDGTLDHRFLSTSAAGRIQAKTGSLSHVNCLSGYATTAGGEHLAFALMSNNQLGGAAAARAQLDRLARALAQ